MPNKSIQQNPACLFALSGSDLLLWYSEDMSALNHLIKCFDSSGRRLHKYFAASIESAILSKKTRNLIGKFLRGTFLGIRNAKSWKLL